MRVKWGATPSSEFRGRCICNTVSNAHLQLPGRASQCFKHDVTLWAAISMYLWWTVVSKAKFTKQPLFILQSAWVCSINDATHAFHHFWNITSPSSVLRYISSGNIAQPSFAFCHRIIVCKICTCSNWIADFVAVRNVVDIAMLICMKWVAYNS